MSTEPDPPLQRQVDLLHRALTLLTREQQALEHGNWIEVERLAVEKLRLYDQLQGMEPLPLPADAPAIDLWRTRQELLVELRRRNEDNGRTIAALRRFHEGAWQLFFGNAQPLYDGIGQVLTTPQSQHLGSA